MHSYTLRGIDKKLYKTLRDQAEKEGVSLNRYMLRILHGAAGGGVSSSERRKANLSRWFGILSEKQADHLE